MSSGGRARWRFYRTEVLGGLAIPAQPEPGIGNRATLHFISRGLGRHALTRCETVTITHPPSSACAYKHPPCSSRTASSFGAANNSHCPATALPCAPAFRKVYFSLCGWKRPCFPRWVYFSKAFMKRSSRSTGRTVARIFNIGNGHREAFYRCISRWGPLFRSSIIRRCALLSVLLCTCTSRESFSSSPTALNHRTTPCIIFPPFQLHH